MNVLKKFWFAPSKLFRKSNLELRSASHDLGLKRLTETDGAYDLDDIVLDGNAEKGALELRVIYVDHTLTILESPMLLLEIDPSRSSQKISGKERQMSDVFFVCWCISLYLIVISVEHDHEQKLPNQFASLLED